MSREEYLNKLRSGYIGKKYGDITILGYDHTEKKHTFYKCKCNCGKEFVTRLDGLKNGHTTSCGCKSDKWMSSGQMNRKHGLSNDRAYWVWTKVKARCYNSNCREYKNYGARGVKMCNEWLNPKTFIEWAYANGYDNTAPKGQCTLDRIDVNGNYEPSNCRFITNLDQQNNRRDCRKFEYNGEIHTIAEWSRIYNIPYPSMAAILKSGKSLDYIKDGYVPRKRH